MGCATLSPASRPGWRLPDDGLGDVWDRTSCKARRSSPGGKGSSGCGGDCGCDGNCNCGGCSGGCGSNLLSTVAWLPDYDGSIWDRSSLMASLREELSRRFNGLAAGAIRALAANAREGLHQETRDLEGFVRWGGDGSGPRLAAPGPGGLTSGDLWCCEVPGRGRICGFQHPTRNEVCLDPYHEECLPCAGDPPTDENGDGQGIDECCCVQKLCVKMGAEVKGQNPGEIARPWTWEAHVTWIPNDKEDSGSCSFDWDEYDAGTVVPGGKPHGYEVWHPDKWNDVSNNRRSYAQLTADWDDMIRRKETTMPVMDDVALNPSQAVLFIKVRSGCAPKTAKCKDCCVLALVVNDGKTINYYFKGHCGPAGNAKCNTDPPVAGPMYPWVLPGPMTPTQIWLWWEASQPDKESCFS